MATLDTHLGGPQQLDGQEQPVGTAGLQLQREQSQSQGGPSELHKHKNLQRRVQGPGSGSDPLLAVVYL